MCCIIPCCCRLHAFLHLSFSSMKKEMVSEWVYARQVLTIPRRVGRVGSFRAFDGHTVDEEVLAHVGVVPEVPTRLIVIDTGTNERTNEQTNTGGFHTSAFVTRSLSMPGHPHLRDPNTLLMGESARLAVMGVGYGVGRYSASTQRHWYKPGTWWEYHSCPPTSLLEIDDCSSWPTVLPSPRQH